jgi:hypothetical protein
MSVITFAASAYDVAISKFGRDLLNKTIKDMQKLFGEYSFPNEFIDLAIALTNKAFIKDIMFYVNTIDDIYHELYGLYYSPDYEMFTKLFMLNKKYQEAFPVMEEDN